MAKNQSEPYEQAAQELLAGYDELLLVPRGAPEGVPPAEQLVHAAGRITTASPILTAQAAGLLAKGSALEREGASGQLIAQASAELQLAAELLRFSSAVQAETPGGMTRAARGAALRQVGEGLREAMSVPASAGLAPFVPTLRRAGPLPQDPQAAAELLRRSVAQADRAISRQVVDLGGEIAFDLVMQTRWAAVLDGASLLRGDAASKLEEVRKGLGGLVEQAAATAEKALLNVYDKVLALLGKDMEDAGRKQVRDWLEKIKEDGKIELLAELVDKLYRVDVFHGELEGWISGSLAAAQKVGETAGEVDQVAQKFIVLSGRIKAFENAVGLAKLTGIPQVLVVVAGLQVGLLAVLVYAGYDYIGFKQGRFLDVTRGVAQVARDGLGGSEKKP